MNQVSAIKTIEEDLSELQNLDPSSLVQRERLGAEYAFEDAVAPAARIISLYKKLPPAALEEFPQNHLTDIHNLVKATKNRFQEILDFSSRDPNAAANHENLVNSLDQIYQDHFNRLFTLISYSMARTVDFNRISDQGRAAVQSIRDENRSLLNEIAEIKSGAEEVLEDVRAAAAEQGVTQQARYFKEEAQSHDQQASDWLWYSVGAGIVVAVYAVLSLFFPSIPFLKAENVQEAVQLTASKILIFFVLAFALFQCVRNFSAHKHNAVINRHRQNALMTYTTLAEAGRSPEARDAILQQAAVAIYAPADTGYLKVENSQTPQPPMITINPKSFAPVAPPDGS